MNITKRETRRENILCILAIIGIFALVAVSLIACFNIPEEPLIKSLDFGSDDAELLMKFAQAEIGDGDWENKGLLMLTILNRVWSPDYPDSIEEVIAHSEFVSAHNNLYLYAEPDKSCEIAIDKIYSGWNESHNSLEFKPVHHMTEQELVEKIVHITEISLVLIAILTVLSIVGLVILWGMKRTDKKE